MGHEMTVTGECGCRLAVRLPVDVGETQAEMIVALVGTLHCADHQPEALVKHGS